MLELDPVISQCIRCADIYLQRSAPEDAVETICTNAVSPVFASSPNCTTPPQSLDMLNLPSDLYPRRSQKRPVSHSRTGEMLVVDHEYNTDNGLCQSWLALGCSQVSPDYRTKAELLNDGLVCSLFSYEYDFGAVFNRVG